MLSAERRKAILELLERQQSVSVSELHELLAVSGMTIRRDLRILSKEGWLERVHGGAILRHPRGYEPPYLTRSSTNIHLKRAIARRAAQIVSEGSSIAIDVGTTVEELAKHLVNVSSLTVLTSSLRVATLLIEAPMIRLIVSGGIVRPSEWSMVGHVAQRTFADFRVDTAFMGVGGIDLTHGLTEFNLEDALNKRTMIEFAERVVVLADSSKLGTACFAFVTPLTQVDVLVTDWQASPDQVAAFEAAGIEVLIARPEDA